jgi:PAS domain S-box-containing protein
LLPEGARARHAEQVAGFAASASASRMMSQRAEVQGRRADGSVFPVEATITKVSVAGAMTFTAQLRDVSARKAAEARLAESERRFRAMFDHAQGALALLSPDGTVLEINRAAQALTVGDETLTGRPLWELPWLGAATAPDAEAGRQRLKEGVAAAARGLAVRFPAELREGDAVHRIDLSLTPITDATGQVIYILPEGRRIAG